MRRQMGNARGVLGLSRGGSLMRASKAKKLAGLGNLKGSQHTHTYTPALTDATAARCAAVAAKRGYRGKGGRKAAGRASPPGQTGVGLADSLVRWHQARMLQRFRRV